MDFNFDIANDDWRRQVAALEAGWVPDIEGELEATRLLYSDLDDAQIALLKDMANWEQ